MVVRGGGKNETMGMPQITVKKSQDIKVLPLTDTVNRNEMRDANKI